MSLRVDLMRPAEYRYQGPVSRKFVALVAGGVLAVSVLLYASLEWVQRANLAKEVAQLSTAWNDMGPRYEVLKKQRAAYAHCEALQKELLPWNKTRVGWSDLLKELGAMVPESIQLTRLSVRCDWNMIKQIAPPSKDPEKPSPQLPGLPARRYFLTLSGRAAGEAGGDEAVRMVNQLKQSAGYSAVFETVKLQNLLRDTQANDLADRSFSIEGVGPLRKLE